MAISEINTALPNKIVIWMNQPSHYQTVFFRELSSRNNILLHVYYGGALPAARRALGWGDFLNENYSQDVLQGYWDGIAKAWHHRRATHVINGLWSVPVFLMPALLLLSAGARVYFHAERPNPSTQRGGLWLIFKRLFVRLLFIRATGLFAIGAAAVVHYRGMGIPRAKIIRFMYFNNAIENENNYKYDKFTIIYVGQFIERKRVSDLIQAFAQIARKHSQARLVLVGSGPLGDAYAAQIAANGIIGCAEISVPLSPQNVLHEIQRSHILVLPSEFDGWGLTINEALQAGVPAICSDGCGAAELLAANPDWGLVYPRGDIAALAYALEAISTDYAKYVPKPDVVAERISPKRMTDLFVDSIRKMSSD